MIVNITALSITPRSFAPSFCPIQRLIRSLNQTFVVRMTIKHGSPNRKRQRYRLACRGMNLNFSTRRRIRSAMRRVSASVISVSTIKTHLRRSGRHSHRCERCHKTPRQPFLIFHLPCCAPCIVDLLELIDIDKQHRQRRTRTTCPGNFTFKNGWQEATVEQAREHIHTHPCRATSSKTAHAAGSRFARRSFASAAKLHLPQPVVKGIVCLTNVMKAASNSSIRRDMPCFGNTTEVVTSLMTEPQPKVGLPERPLLSMLESSITL